MGLKFKLPGRLRREGAGPDGIAFTRLDGAGADIEAGADGNKDANGDKDKKKEKKGFNREHWQQFKSLLPHLWPEGEPLLRAKICVSFTCLFLVKLQSVGVPLALKAAVDTVGRGEVPVLPVIMYAMLRFGSDTSKELRDCLFNEVSAHAARQISLRAFSHVQSLSLNFHLNRKTGAVMRALSRGSASYSELLRYIAFQIFPVFLEVTLVCSYLFTRYSWYFGVITFGVVAFYFAFTISTTEWRNKFRRKMTEQCAEDHERGVFGTHLKSYQDASIVSQRTLSLLNVGQNAIISTGVGLAMYLAGNEVGAGRMTVGDFVLVNVFILQLYTPLNFLGTYYRMIKQALVDVEAMFKLLAEKQEIVDDPSAVPLNLSVAGPSVEFKDVVFAYKPDLPPTLKGISFSVPTGKKVAIVGTTGAGKSTISRLLYRMYEPQGGDVRVAGQSIYKCTQRSLRMAIGIVPQDCVLFNDTIQYNIGYGKVGEGNGIAPLDQVEKAARGAQIIDFINRQKEGWDTMVGERGLRLSGGEKQRVAIARAMLKNPPIMMYDEATSALDTTTEREIQSTMDDAARGRTTLVIAHRLSTVMDSDEILVLEGGEIIERGSGGSSPKYVFRAHEELLGAEGKYCEMWNKQLTSMTGSASSSNLRNNSSSANLSTLGAPSPAAPPAPAAAAVGRAGGGGGAAAAGGAAPGSRAAKHEAAAALLR